MAFGEKLGNKLSEKNISQATLSEKTGIPKSTLNCMISRDVGKVDIDVFLKICKALDCNPEEFYNECNPSKITPSFERKYNKLDDYGTKAVDDLLDNEYARCTAIEEPSDCETIELPFSQLKASAGLGDYLFDEDFETVEVARTYESEQATFAIEVDGDSMEPEFSNGDIVLVKGTQFVEVGEIGIFIIDGDGYIKECGENELISLNPDYSNIKPSEFSDFRTIGRVIGKAELTN